MFPRWEFDAEDSAANNIIKVMFNSNPKWKWTTDCWEVNQMNEVIAAETLSGLKEDSGRPRKKARKGDLKEARKEAPVEAPKDEIEKSLNALAAAMRDGFEMCLKEIKLLGDRLEAVEKKAKAPQKYAIPQLHDSQQRVNLAFLYWTNEYPLLQTYGRVISEGRQRRIK
ncbi:hypothetical protein Bca52824_001042 [Brassica carinata]|uniref:Uncharacterized protein n=1 Tax=Brassica carinata TaxID=52824 RepID=A0A8X8BDG1_BRACI|nr:hypothetical protein Bca52824_001042 [Brassica carinata]